jgi:hypothetical protein
MTAYCNLLFTRCLIDSGGLCCQARIIWPSLFAPNPVFRAVLLCGQEGPEQFVARITPFLALFKQLHVRPN